MRWLLSESSLKLILNRQKKDFKCWQAVESGAGGESLQCNRRGHLKPLIWACWLTVTGARHLFLCQPAQLWEIPFLTAEAWAGAEFLAHTGIVRDHDCRKVNKRKGGRSKNAHRMPFSLSWEHPWGSGILALTRHSLFLADVTPNRIQTRKRSCLPAAFVGVWWATWSDLQQWLQGALALSCLCCSPILIHAWSSTPFTGPALPHPGSGLKDWCCSPAWAGYMGRKSFFCFKKNKCNRAFPPFPFTAFESPLLFCAHSYKLVNSWMLFIFSFPGLLFLVVNTSWRAGD